MEQLSPTLTTLLIAVLGTLTTLVGLIGRRLNENTQLTRETKQAADGALSDALERLAGERNRTLGLREIVREREDRLAYILARHPEVAVTMEDYRERRTRRVTEADERAAEQAALGPKPGPQGAARAPPAT